jgi:hypothetical protein
MTLYPNPSSDKINLTFNKELKTFTVEIFNSRTKATVFKKAYENVSEKETTIDVNRLEEGIYILRLSINQDVIITRKFVKK